MISAFRIRNFRSISDSNDIEIRKINVLVGKNSSGKSTLLRFLPLLRQSVEQPTKGPLLWYGRLVDFGSFENAARDNDVTRGVSFDFSVVLPKRPAQVRRTLAQQTGSTEFFWSRLGLPVRVSLTLGRSQKDRVGNIREASIVIGSDAIEIAFGENGIESLSVLGRPVNLGAKKSWGFLTGKLFPAPILIEEMQFQDEDGEKHSFLDYSARPFLSEISAALRQIAHGRTSSERIASIANRLLYAQADEFFARVVDLPGVSEDLRARIALLGPHSLELTNLRRFVLLSRLTQLIQALDEEVASFATSVRYVEPIRATAERYYRQQDLAVDEVDSRGANTAMFLESLADHERLDLKGWMKENLGFWVVIEPGVGHVQVKIEDETHSPRNIADLGFGYSQILPIALQLWRNSRRNLGRRATLLAMEQPELHLHPDYQAKLADVIASCAKAPAPVSSFRAFIETHSDHLINRLGKLVSEGALNPRDVQVLVVTDGPEGSSSVRRVAFDSDGFLGDGWPLGFFTPGSL
jgi:predicted ATPase